ncbi:MAG: dihydroneopterin aldolase, partial [Chitinophagales bacterium]
MAKITIEGMQFKSHIGVYDYEQLYGNNFEVELSVESTAIESVDDEIRRTIDYDHLYSIVQQVMSGRYKLIETACMNIINTIRMYNVPA